MVVVPSIIIIVLVVINKYNNYDAMCVCIYKNITECYYIIIKYHGKREIQKYFSSFIWVDSLSALSPIKDPPSKA